MISQLSLSVNFLLSNIPTLFQYHAQIGFSLSLPSPLWFHSARIRFDIIGFLICKTNEQCWRCFIISIWSDWYFQNSESCWLPFIACRISNKSIRLNFSSLYPNSRCPAFTRCFVIQFFSSVFCKILHTYAWLCAHHFAALLQVLSHIWISSSHMIRQIQIAQKFVLADCNFFIYRVATVDDVRVKIQARTECQMLKTVITNLKHFKIVWIEKMMQISTYNVGK